MPYFEPYFDETGFHYPSFQDIKDYYISGAKETFGEDIYVDDDSMDGQQISILAKAAFDCMKSIELASNNYSAKKAYGNTLSSLVKLAGISRNVGGYSTVYLELQGLPYAQIRNGRVKDEAGYFWKLPTEVTLGSNGFLYVTAVCETEGSIVALPNTVNIIDTPTYGWQAVTNLIAANPAQPLENDIELFNRYQKSTSLPAIGLTDALTAALLDLGGVISVRVVENATNEPVFEDGVGLVPHSIVAVVQGGSEAEIANTIFLKKSQGCATNGTTSVIVHDRYHNVNVINFYRPAVVEVYIDIKISPRYNYNTSYEGDIKDRLVEYINSIGISNDIIRSVLAHEAYDCNSDLKMPAFSIESLQIGTSTDNLGENDITILLNEIAHITPENINLEVLI